MLSFTTKTKKIMNCLDCNHPINIGSKFCANCGRNFQISRLKNVRDTKATSRPQSNGRVINTGSTSSHCKHGELSWPNPEAMSYIAELIENRKKRTEAKAPRSMAFLAVGAVCAFIGFWLFMKDFSIPIGGAIILFIFVLFSIKCWEFRDWLIENEYRAVPQAIDFRGKLRCVFCGHVGIYKHGGYKTNTIWHDCSKCKKTLFFS